MLKIVKQQRVVLVLALIAIVGVGSVAAAGFGPRILDVWRGESGTGRTTSTSAGPQIIEVRITPDGLAFATTLDHLGPGEHILLVRNRSGRTSPVEISLRDQDAVEVARIFTPKAEDRHLRVTLGSGRYTVSALGAEVSGFSDTQFEVGE